VPAVHRGWKEKGDGCISLLSRMQELLSDVRPEEDPAASVAPLRDEKAGITTLNESYIPQSGSEGVKGMMRG
jgi:hypothetical protein